MVPCPRRSTIEGERTEWKPWTNAWLLARPVCSNDSSDNLLAGVLLWEGREMGHRTSYLPAQVCGPGLEGDETQPRPGWSTHVRIRRCIPSHSTGAPRRCFRMATRTGTSGAGGRWSSMPQMRQPPAGTTKPCRLPPGTRSRPCCSGWHSGCPRCRSRSDRSHVLDRTYR